MAAAQTSALTPAESFEASRAERRQAVDSVLGTMNAEGELPCDETIALMNRFVDGELSMDELTERILANAHR